MKYTSLFSLSLVAALFSTTPAFADPADGGDEDASAVLEAGADASAEDAAVADASFTDAATEVDAEAEADSGVSLDAGSTPVAANDEASEGGGLSCSSSGTHGGSAFFAGFGIALAALALTRKTRRG